MNTFRIFALALFTILLCLSACSGGGDEPIEPTPKPEVVKSEITIDSNIISNGLSFTNEKGEQSISFTTNENWTLSVASTTSGTTWCTASATSGIKGNSIIKFTVTENTDYVDRSVSATIKSGTATKTFKITQKCKEAFLVTTNKYEINQEGGTIDIEVKSNIDYKMEISEAAKSWISESSSRGLTSHKHSFNISVNEESEKREGEIYFKSNNKVETVKVYQSGGAVLILSKKEVNVSDKGETISVDVKSNVEFGVQMPDVDWITDEASSRGLSSHTMKYIVKSNETFDSRSAEIIFYDKNSDLKDTLKVVQAQKDAIIIAKSEYTVGAAGCYLDFEVNTNVDFKVETSVDWIKQNKNSRGLKAKPLSFTIAENTADEAREGLITLTYGKLKQQIKVMQKAMSTFSVSKTQFDVESAGGKIQVKVSTNGEYTVTMPKADWLKETTSRATTTYTHTFSVSENKTHDMREAEITFTHKETNETVKVKVVQAQKDAIIIGKKEYEVKAEGETIEIKLESNVNFEISIEDDWIKQVESQSTRSLVSHKLYFQIVKNESEKMRSAQIKIKDKQITETILIKQKGKVDGIPYLTFTADAEQTLTMSKAVATLEYSVNGGEWNTLGTTIVTFGANNGDLRLRGQSSIGTANSTSDYATIKFGMDVIVACTGDIRTLVDYINYKNVNTSKARFCSLFENCTNLVSAPNLPATILANWCYEFMFSKCTSLKTAPELPAVNLAEGCYRFMFSDCTTLTTPPKLPATKLVDLCYKSMFSDCIALTIPPKLPATKLAYNCYNAMFSGCTSLKSAPALPATTLSEDCYSVMFSNCTSLVIAPELPATELAGGCYAFMFSGCTNLKSAPKLPAMEMATRGCYAAMFEKCVNLEIPPALPATTLSEDCYHKMFSGCTSLKSTPELPATTLSEGCYSYMFSGCTSLKSTPELPATTLSEGCYSYMFSGCTSLTVAPKLPATKLAVRCYDSMFEYCSCLTLPPELPATKLENYCYAGMFADCTSLTSAPILSATDLNKACYFAMFYGCTKLTTAPILPATDLSVACYEYMFSSCTSLTEAPELPARILKENSYREMFNNCSKLNSITMLATDVSGINCLTNWVKGVSSVGKFTKSEEMESLTIGNNGIPAGWTIKNYGEE